MKKMRIILICGVAAVIAALAVFLYVRNQGVPTKNDALISSFYYSHSGSSTYEMYSYEIDADEESGETMAYYEFNNGNETYSLPADGELMGKLAAIVDSHNLRKWDGFNKTNSLVVDGDGFYLSIDFADGTSITARGSNSVPDGYSDAVDAIEELFHSHLTKHGVERQDS